MPDPETLLDVDLILLQAISWSGGSVERRYSEGGLKLAVLGSVAYPGGIPLGPGLQRCPQFGALRYLRAAERRWDEALKRQLGAGLVTRDQVSRNGREYSSLQLSELGISALGGRRG